MKRCIQAILGIICILCLMTVSMYAQASDIKDENILFEAENVILYVDGEIRMTTGEYLNDLEIDVILENNSTKKVSVYIDTACINGWVVYAYGMGSPTPAGRKQRGELCFSLDNLDIGSLDDIHTIEIEWQLFDDDRYMTFATIEPLTLSFSTENGQSKCKISRGSSVQTETSVSWGPTDAPTERPTSTPTVKPTATPTVKPTFISPVSPTQAPADHHDAFIKKPTFANFLKVFSEVSSYTCSSPTEKNPGEMFSTVPRFGKAAIE